MATASELKAKVTKILTIVEYLEDENISVIEKDILLQAIRELYSDILLTRTDVSVEEKTAVVEENEIEENVQADVEEKPSEPPVIAIPFDAGDFDFHDLLDMNRESENVDEPVAVEDVYRDESPAEVTEAPVSGVVVENVAEESAEIENTAEVAVETSEMQNEITENVIEEQVADVQGEMEVPEDITEAQEEPIGETTEEEPKYENGYFSQNESVSSDYSDSVSTMEEPAAENCQEEASNQSEVENVVAEENTEKADDVIVAEDMMVDEQPELVAEVVSEEIEEPTYEPVTEEHPEEISEPSAEAKEAVEDSVEEQVVFEPEETAEPAIAEEPVAPVEPIQQEPEPEKVLTLGEQLGQSRQESLYDKLASNASADLSSRIGLKPIADIRSSIGLGERYRFTRMLFAGNGSAFDDTVAKLNQMSSMEEAEGYVRASFNWDMESPIVSDFMNIVRRRYL